MHNGTIQAGDSWLKSHLNGYVNWAQKNNSLLILTWDEDDMTQNNQIATIFVGQMVNSGQYNELINHYNVLRTIEDMYGLPYLGKTSTANPITDIWVVPGGRSAAGTPHASANTSQAAALALETFASESQAQATPGMPESATAAVQTIPAADQGLGFISDAGVGHPLHLGVGPGASRSGDPLWQFFQNDDEIASLL
jgi:hypothetical protein